MYNLFVDEMNSPPMAYEANWIIARSLDDAIENLSRHTPDLIVFGNTRFEFDLLDWMHENKKDIPLDFLFEPHEKPNLINGGIF